MANSPCSSNPFTFYRLNCSNRYSIQPAPAESLSLYYKSHKEKSSKLFSFRRLSYQRTWFYPDAFYPQMRKLLKKILYRGINITEYTSITLDKDISEKVFLEIAGSKVDVSSGHWALCLEPVIFGIWISNDLFDLSKDKSCKLLFEEKNGKKLAEVRLSAIDGIKEKDGCLLLARVEECKLFHVSSIESSLLYNVYYRKQGFSFNKFKSYVSAFSYPRKVRLVSFKKDDYYNIFPMDFVGEIGLTNYYVFGLRHTNKTLPEIIKEKRIAVSEVPFTYKDNIYQLGRHHSSHPPPLEQLPFKTHESKNFGFPVPGDAICYNEINLTKTINLGSHMLLWGESGYREIKSNSQEQLYHIHFLLDLFLERNGIAYTRV